jgi:tRNA pseudouridine32 synthase/23S rRNA pseudouridine746 synthase/23S rRNA pseudouridine1911/1915/1917 synthase
MESKIKIRTKYMPRGVKVLYEDRFIIVIDKAAGLLSVKANYEEAETAHQLLTQYVRKGEARAKTELFVVHRLDRETSGILIFAKTLEIRELFAKDWKNVKKTYLALVYGKFKKKTDILESYLKEEDDYSVRTVSGPEEGKFARTRYRVINETRKYSLLEVDLLTGKKHQIRVHLSEAGHPIAGDIKYGSTDRNKGRLALHAWRIHFKHPCTKEDMFFETEIPQCFGLQQQEEVKKELESGSVVEVPEELA